MTATLQQRQSSTGEWSFRLASFAAILFLASAAGHRFGLLETVPFFWLLGLAGVIGGLGLAGGFLALVQVWEHGVTGAGRATAGIFVALCVLAPYGISLARLIEHPRLIDISTDVSDPPTLDAAAAKRSGAMNRIAAITPEAAVLQKEHYPDVTGRRYEHTVESVLETVRAMMTERNWQPRQPASPALAGGEITIEGEARSFFLGFPADVAVRIADDGAATYVDMRSTSRYALHDLGDNALRINRFLDALDQRLSGESGV